MDWGYGSVCELWWNAYCGGVEVRERKARAEVGDVGISRRRWVVVD